MMGFERPQMLYDDGKYYKWVAGDGRDNAYYYYKPGAGWADLNRTEGNEVLYFINHIAAKHWPDDTGLATYQKIEKMIRFDVPHSERTRKKIAGWIVANYSNEIM
ncbi:MAG: hypothetical protein M3N14_09965 [Bacteroidota bacterium]|nr:hypothetical protein [Bacteroidota bacterium]